MRNIWLRLVMIALLGILCSACSVTRKLSEGEYFLQRVKIEDDKQTPKDERITSYTLEQYVRQTPNKRFLGTNFYVWTYNLANPKKDNWWNNLKRKIGEEPVLLDLSLTHKSAQNLKTYMDSRGYYSSSAEYEIDTTRRPKRAYVTYRTHQGEPYRISSISYDFRDKQIAPVIEADSASSLLHVGEIFDITTLDKERERIASYLNDRGYYNFSINNIEYRVDTLQGERQAGIRMIIKRNITGYDERGRAITANNRIYRIDEIDVLTDYNPAIAEEEYRKTRRDTTFYQGLNIISQGKPNVRPQVMHSTIPLTPNTIYNSSQVDRTYSEIMSLGYFKSARIAFEELPRSQNDSLLVNYAGDGRTSYSPKKFEDIREGYLRCYIFCSPTLKQGFNVEVEGSTTSSFYGLSATVGYQNRNIFRGAEMLEVTGTAGYEYMKAPNSKKRHAVEFGVAASLSFPRFLLANYAISSNILAPKTKFEISYNYQDRPYYQRGLSGLSWMYSWRNRQNSSFVVRPIAINWVDVSYIDDAYFNSLQNQYLKYSFQSQLIVAISGSYTLKKQYSNAPNNQTTVRANCELSGNLLNGLVHLFSKPTTDRDYYELFGIRYSQYARADVDASHRIMFGKVTALAARVYAGVAYAYGNSDAVPFDRLFYAGGSNSMRGWAPRTLGPGNTPAEQTAFPVQMGDIRLEANAEVRFPIWGMFHGATFIDVGNVWYMGRDKAQVPADGIFHFDKFYKQLGLNSGLGLRIDITFVIAKEDNGWKIISQECDSLYSFAD